MKKLLSTLLFSFIISFSLFANVENTFQQANELYSNGEYTQAIELYDSLINSNVSSANIYYNIGNSYFKLDDIPNAILYFEKAKKIEPNNLDIIYNIELANTRIADKIEQVPQFFLKTIYLTTLNSLTEKQWTTVNISLFIIFLIFIVLFYTRSTNRRLWLSFSIAFIILTFTSGIIGFQSYKQKTTHNTAIIFTPTIDIKSAPDTKSNTIFILHQGTKISLLEKTAQWQKVRIASGSEGWLKTNNIIEI